MADKDTVSPYDDDDVDPYAADDTKNPHEPSEGEDAPDEEAAEDETAQPAPRKATRTTKKTTKR